MPQLLSLVEFLCILLTAFSLVGGIAWLISLGDNN